MTQTIEAAGLTFLCDDPLEVWRAQTWAEKEPGTVAWIETFQPGEVFYDIGANIGVYTLLAARKVGPTGKVIAVEPHLGNALALMQNVQANGFGDRVIVVAAPLQQHRAHRDWFTYRSLRTGSSGSQYGARGGAVREFKISTSIDALAIDCGRPTHIKVDVDGLEVPILTGMRDTLLLGVASVQMETEPQHREWLINYFWELGYEISAVHYTSNGEAAIRKGANPADVISNTIFRRKQ